MFFHVRPHYRAVHNNQRVLCVSAPRRRGAPPKGRNRLCHLYIIGRHVRDALRRHFRAKTRPCEGNYVCCRHAVVSRSDCNRLVQLVQPPIESEVAGDTRAAPPLGRMLQYPQALCPASSFCRCCMRRRRVLGWSTQQATVPLCPWPADASAVAGVLRRRFSHQPGASQRPCASRGVRRRPAHGAARLLRRLRRGPHVDPPTG